MLESKLKFCVVGAGKYGSAVGYVIQKQVNNSVTYLVRRQEQADEINNLKTNLGVSDLIKFDENVSATTDVAEAVKDADFIFLSIPAQTLPDFLRANKALFEEKSYFVNCKEIGHKDRYVVLSGPSFAKEVFQEHPTMVTLASHNKEVLNILQARIYCHFFKCYIQYDVAGIEFSGAVKNILALGAGYVDGLGYGFNTMAAFVTRGIKEVQHLSIAFGSDPLSLYGLAGAGDIMLSCFGKLSRNRTTGYRLAKGEKLEDVMADIGTVEGIPTLKVMYKVVQEQPNTSFFMIIKTIHEIIFSGMKSEEAKKFLMTNLMSHEFKGLPYSIVE